MKVRPNYKYALLIFCILLSGCELLCQAGTATCGLSREQAEKLLNPKAFGEYWIKPGVTRESWERDWISCGGFKDGQYAGNAPAGSTTEAILASRREERKKLSQCMESKGYEYRNENKKS